MATQASYNRTWKTFESMFCKEPKFGGCIMRDEDDRDKRYNLGML